MKTSRRSFLQRSITGAATVAVWRGLPIIAAGESKAWEFKPDQNIIPAPANPADWPAFREQLEIWRTASEAAARTTAMRSTGSRSSPGRLRRLPAAS